MSSYYFRFSIRGAAERDRSPLLERLLAGADEATAVTDWREEAYRALAPQASAMPGVGPAALYAQNGIVEGAWAFCATPVHYIAETSNVRLARDGMLSLGAADAGSLCREFNRVWHDADVRLLAGAAGDLFCVADRPLPAATCDPEKALDRYIDDYLPRGDAAPQLRRLMSEIEMWLFEHPVNRARLAANAPPVTGLWLWGGGATLRSAPPATGWTAGRDPLFKSLGMASPTDATGAPGPAVIVVGEQPGTAGWRDIESRWLRPAIASLRHGALSRLDLSAGDRCFHVRARWRRRFWRRSRPWWESYP